MFCSSAWRANRGEAKLRTEQFARLHGGEQIVIKIFHGEQGPDQRAIGPPGGGGLNPDSKSVIIHDNRRVAAEAFVHAIGHHAGEGIIGGTADHGVKDQHRGVFIGDALDEKLAIDGNVGVAKLRVQKGGGDFRDVVTDGIMSRKHSGDCAFAGGCDRADLRAEFAHSRGQATLHSHRAGEPSRHRRRLPGAFDDVSRHAFRADTLHAPSAEKKAIADFQYLRECFLDGADDRAVAEAHFDLPFLRDGSDILRIEAGARAAQGVKKAVDNGNRWSLKRICNMRRNDLRGIHVGGLKPQLCPDVRCIEQIVCRNIANGRIKLPRGN